MQVLEAKFQYLIYAPKGEIEGALLLHDGKPVQIVIDRHDPEAGDAFVGVSVGQTVEVRVTAAEPSSKGQAVHTVYDFSAIDSVDGKKLARSKPRLGPAYQGKVVRFNFAKHGEPNGVVLDSGDFIHTKPEGMKHLRLKIGDTVQADGDAQRLADDTGWAVDATTVNNKPVKLN